LVKDAKAMRIGKRDNKWHFFHFQNPRWANEDSNMPSYDFLFERKTDFKSLPTKISVQRQLGVPFPAWTKDEIEQQAREQGMEIARSLFEGGSPVSYEPMKNASSQELVRHFSESEVVALIAYIQKLGTYREIEKATPPEANGLDPDSRRDLDERTQEFRRKQESQAE
jgi:cytochrome c oxidase cbb3-type subunit I/II